MIGPGGDPLVTFWGNMVHTSAWGASDLKRTFVKKFNFTGPDSNPGSPCGLSFFLTNPAEFVT